MTGPAIPQVNLDYFWNVLVNPRIGSATHEADAYDWGGSFSRDDINQGTDCSGAVSAEASAMVRGAAAIYQRQWYTGTFAGIRPGAHGPFAGIADTADWVCIAHPGDAPADAAMTIAIRQRDDPTDAHMICRVQGIDIEMGGDADNYHTTRTESSCASVFDMNEFNQWFYIDRQLPAGALPPPGTSEPPDTIFADVSEFQCAVDDSYTADIYRDGGADWNYRWLSIRSNDGTHQDANFADNYAWCVKAVTDGRLAGFIVYYYWRPGGTGVDTHISMVEAAGGPHASMVSMMDIESGGNPSGDQSSELTAEYDRLAQWYGGDSRRVIGYANVSDERSMWAFKPHHVPFILAGYGANPDDPDVYKIAHQYTDGTGYGGGLPEGADPFGSCDMNSADGFTPTELAGALGLPTPQQPPPPPNQWADILNQFTGGNTTMATPDDVQAQLVDNNDQVTLFDGASYAYKTPSLRHASMKAASDLLRVQKPADHGGAFDPAVPVGFRDAVSRLLRTVELNNQLLLAIAKATNADTSSVTVK